jgi:4-amino-4-deoxy-L-arabinose transferase-like glycosyltransferase
MHFLASPPPVPSVRPCEKVRVAPRDEARQRNQTIDCDVLNSKTVEPNPSASKTENVSMAAKIGWTVLILATLYVCYFSHLGAIGFVGPDEPRYAWIARDMVESGDWVTPRLYGKPWFEKPVLYYWGAAASFKLFGVSEAAARLPSAISALLATLALAWLALRLYGAETARWLLLLLPTTVGMIGFSHAAATDMPFSAMLTIAMVCAAVVLRLVPAVPHPDSFVVVAGLVYPAGAPPAAATPQSLPFAPPAAATAPSPPPASTTPSFFGPLWPALILFGFFLGLAVLAKGPAAIILSGGAVSLWAVFTKRWRDAFRLFHPAALAAFCATALPWYILCARRNPDFFRIFIIEHNFKRYLTPEFQHIQPPWFYLPVLLVAFLPWTGIFLWSAFFGVRLLWREHRLNDTTLLLLCWAAFCVVFFSISHSKLPGYILPSVPAICLLVAHSCAALAPVHRKSFRLTLLAVTLVLSFLFIIFAFAKSIDPHLSQAALKFAGAVGVLAALLAAANLILGIAYLRHGKSLPRNLAAAAVIPILFALSLTNYLLASFFQWDPSGRSIAREVQIRKIPLEQFEVVGMNRGLQYSLSFYLHEEVKNWDPSYPTMGYVLTGKHSCRTLVPVTFACEEVPIDYDSTGRFLYLVTPAIEKN